MEILPSPNRNSRCGFSPDVICCHQSNAPISERLRCFSDPESGESVHFAVTKTGNIYQFVEIDFAAMAIAGREAFPLCPVVNSRAVCPDLYTISVEFENERSGVLTKEQYISGLDLFVSLIRQIRRIYGVFCLDRAHFIGHYEASPASAFNCPGLDFPLNLYVKDLKQLFGERND